MLLAYLATSILLCADTIQYTEATNSKYKSHQSNKLHKQSTMLIFMNLSNRKRLRARCSQVMYKNCFWVVKG